MANPIIGPGMMGLFQYPDKRLYNAAVVLPPEARPTVPVKLFEDASDVEPRYKRNDPNVRAFIQKETPNAIHIKRSELTPRGMFGDKRKLAGIMGHEEGHIRGDDEFDARKRELALLRALGLKDDVYIANRGLNTRVK